MISVMLKQPQVAYNVIDTRTSSAKISGGGLIYEPKQYLSGGDFEGSAGLWDFYNADASAVEEPTSEIAINYDEAKSGGSCLEVTFASTGEYLMSRIASAQKEKEVISGKRLDMKFWVKNSSAGLVAFIRVYDEDAVIAYVDQAVPVVTAWTEVVFGATFSYPTAEEDLRDLKIMVGFAMTGTPPKSCLIDLVSVYTPNDFSDVPLSSYITVSPNLYVANVSDYVGDYLVVSGGNNDRYGSLISGITHSSGNISRIDLYEVFPFAFADGDEFAIVYPNYNRRSGGGASASVGAYVTSCSVSSDIESGYTTATVKLNRSAAWLIQSYNLIDWDLSILDDGGEVWNGFVAECSTDGMSLDITGYGYKRKLDYIYYSSYYDSEPENTAPAIVADILELVPDYLQSADSALDRGSVLHDAQYASGGIGPMDFLSSPQKASECISKVLSLGAFDEDFSPVYLQMWGRVPELRIISRKTTFADVKYIIEPVFSPVDKGVTYNVGLDSKSTAVYTTYKGLSGDQLETPRLYDLQEMINYGIIERNISGGSASDAEADIYLNAALDDVVPGVSTGEIKISGMVRRAGSSVRCLASQIRGGDAIFVPEILGNMTTAFDLNGNYEIVVAGNVTSDLVTGVTTITPYNAPERVEFVVNLLDVSVGG